MRSRTLLRVFVLISFASFIGCGSTSDPVATSDDSAKPKKSAYDRIEKGMRPSEVEALLRECVEEEKLTNVTFETLSGVGDEVGWIGLKSDSTEIDVGFTIFGEVEYKIRKKPSTESKKSMRLGKRRIP